MTSADTAPRPLASSSAASAGVLTWATLAIAVAGLAGSLFLSLGMNLKACPLCFYQRTFMMSVVAVLVMGLLGGAARPGRPALLALPLAVAGLGVALFHVSLELRSKLECPAGVLGLGSAPQQSLAVFLVLTVLLTLDGLRSPSTGTGSWAAPALAVVLGALLAVASCVANPPPPAAPARAYDQPPEICRPPYQPR
jgi:disulfide bond formation protein DsbB